MKRIFAIPFLALALTTTSMGCDPDPKKQTSESKDKKAVQAQQSQYAKGQPIPHFDWSLERDLLISLYTLRNQKVATHSVWRSEMGMVEGDCPSIGFGLPYDTSLTNPLQSEWRAADDPTGIAVAGISIGQAEPNGVFQSTNTSATWVMCVDDGGALAPIYIEAKVTVYPYAVVVDYDLNRVVRSGTEAVTINPSK